MNGVRVAVVGVTGAVGQTTLRILEERKFPVRELRAFASERSVGKTVTFQGEPVRVEKVAPGAFAGVDIAFFSAGSAQSKAYAPQAVKAGGAAPRRVIPTSFQAVSGAGVNGVEELRSQTLAWARGEALTPRFFLHQIAFNVIPHIDPFGG